MDILTEKQQELLDAIEKRDQTPREGGKGRS